MYILPENIVDLSAATIEPVRLPILEPCQVQLDVLRLDKIHPVISGNKWFKLKYYIEEAQRQEASTIATFGGAWSNHIAATAYACKLARLQSVGIIRGENSATPSTTLQEAVDN